MLPRDFIRRLHLEMPVAILADGYRPLSFLAAELILALAPFLPWDEERSKALARRWQLAGGEDGRGEDRL
jgi:hypothetical protein